MIPVFFASDENYAKYMAVTIRSIIAGTSEKISFFILDGGLTSLSKTKLTALIKGTKHRLEFISMDLEAFKHLPHQNRFSINTFFRYIIPQLKPDLHKALYLDTDMVVCGDIAEIFHQDLSGYGLGAIPYPEEKAGIKEYQNYKKKLGLHADHIYFNAGLLLIDCDYWRKRQVTEHLFQETVARQTTLEMPDQDILNLMFMKNYQELPQQYNVIVDVTERMTGVQKYIGSLSGCFILHFTGGFGMRPWVQKSVPGASYFWQFAQETPFYTDLQFDLLSNQLDAVQRKTKLLSSVHTIKLFNCIPILTCRYHGRQRRIYLFGFIPLFSVSAHA